MDRGQFLHEAIEKRRRRKKGRGLVRKQGSTTDGKPGYYACQSATQQPNVDTSKQWCEVSQVKEGEDETKKKGAAVVKNTHRLSSVISAADDNWPVVLSM